MKIKEKGAVCEQCKQHMLVAKGCKYNCFMDKKGRKYQRILGEDLGEITGTRCHDCGIICDGTNAHHFGCDSEYCPICKEQFAFCGCAKALFTSKIKKK